MGTRAFLLQCLMTNLEHVSTQEGYTTSLVKVWDYIGPDRTLNEDDYPLAIVDYVGDTLAERGDQANLSVVRFNVTLLMRNASQYDLLNLVDDAEQVITRFKYLPIGVSPSIHSTIHQWTVEEIVKEPLIDNDERMQSARLTVVAECYFVPQQVAFG